MEKTLNRVAAGMIVVGLVVLFDHARLRGEVRAMGAELALIRAQTMIPTDTEQHREMLRAFIDFLETRDE